MWAISNPFYKSKCKKYTQNRLCFFSYILFIIKLYLQVHDVFFVISDIGNHQSNQFICFVHNFHTRKNGVTNLNIKLMYEYFFFITYFTNNNDTLCHFTKISYIYITLLSNLLQ